MRETPTCSLMRNVFRADVSFEGYRSPIVEPVLQHRSLDEYRFHDRFDPISGDDMPLICYKTADLRGEPSR